MIEMLDAGEWFPRYLTSTKREIEVNESKDRVEFFFLFQSFMLQLSYLI